MKLRNPRERKPSMRSADVIRAEQESAPAFSAHNILLEKADALQGDLRITTLSRQSSASLIAKLHFLVPEKASDIYRKPAEPFPQLPQDLTGQGHNLLLYAHLYPGVRDFLKAQYSAIKLKSHVSDSFQPGTRPDVWPLLVGKALFPEAEGWELQPDRRTYMLDWVEDRVKGDSNWDDLKKAASTAADLVLLDPSLKPLLQIEIKSVLAEFNRRVERIFGNTNELVETAYDLEIIYGNKIEGVDEHGVLQLHAPSVATRKELPERLTA